MVCSTDQWIVHVGTETTESQNMVQQLAENRH